MNRRSGSSIVRILILVAALGFAITPRSASGAPAAAALDIASLAASVDPPPSDDTVNDAVNDAAVNDAVNDDIVVDTANPFLPENRDLTDCVGTVERPGCGSESRGGWRQNLVAIVMVAGLLIVFGRVAWGVRRSQQQSNTSP